MSGKNISPSSKWCILRDNSKIRLAVEHRIKERGLTLAQLERDTGIQAYRLSRFRNKRKPNITQYQLINLCEYLGIEIDVKVKFTQ